MNRDALESCQLEIAKLRGENVAFASIMKLLESFLAMAHSADHGQLLITSMRKTLEVAGELTGAEIGSLFLFDEKGAVKESLLARGKASASERDRLIGMVLEDGLAGWVRKNKKAGIVYDTREDKRWLSLPNEKFPVRSALAVPVHRSDSLFGILTLTHSSPNCFSADDLELIQMTADQIALVLENVDLYEKLDESYHHLEHAKHSIERYSKALDRELDKGRQIQCDFLPQKILEIPHWQIDVWFSPAFQVAGDFYDVFQLPDNYVGVVIADVCDKGVGSALFMALFRSLIRVFSGQVDLKKQSLHDYLGYSCETHDSPIDAAYLMPRALNAINLTNHYIVQNHSRMGMFATVFFGVLDPVNAQMAYINAGHEPLHIVGADGVKAILMPTGPSVGLIEDIRYKAKNVTLAPGDILVGHTDGVTEARSEGDILFGRDRFYAIIDQGATSVSDLMNPIRSELTDFIGAASPSDDITLIALQRTE
jgi:sigma-B regulation protein RsbU (phosphoserine phosphatase)